MKILLSLVIVSIVGITGCASSPRRSLSEVSGVVRERSGLETRLEEPAPDPSSLLKSPLTPDAAARIALAANAAFKVKLEEIGLAQSDLTQAGILANPRVHGNVRYAGGSSSREGHELGVKINLLDFFELPLRRRIASERLEQAKARLADEVLGLVAETKSAFYRYVAAVSRLSLKKEAFDSLDAAVEIAQRQREAGNISRLDLATQRAELQDAAADIAREESQVGQARERLAMILGIQARTGWSVEAELPEVPADDPAPEKVEAAAVAQRWDLQAARQDPQVLARMLTVERARIFSPVEIGVDTEREYSGESKYGPEFELGLPLFDRRQAVAAQLRARRRQSLASADALEASIRYEARALSHELAAARKAAAAYREALPHRREALQETLKNYNYMLVGVDRLLEAKRRELAAATAYIEALMEYWSLRVELERTAGGLLPQGEK